MKGKQSLKIVFGILVMMTYLEVSEVRSQAPVSLQNTVTHLLYSEQLQQHYLVDVFLPRGYQPKESDDPFPKYPVIYVLNSRPNAVMAASLRHVSQMSREIIVGIDFADEDGNPIDSFSAYTRDLTPTPDEDWPQVAFGGTGGHADDFLRFLEESVKPFIDENYSVHPKDRTLVGHSFGGLFALHVLLTKSDAFSRYLIASPSLWWDDSVIFRSEENYAETHTNMDKNVFISVGSREFVSGSQGMVENTQSMFEKLESRNYPDLQLTFRMFEDETHESVVGISIQKGIESVFR